MILFAISLPHDKEFRTGELPPSLPVSPRSYPDAARLALGEHNLKLRGSQNPYTIHNDKGQTVGEVKFLARGPVFSWFTPVVENDLALFTSIERHRLVQTGKTLYRPLMTWLATLATPAGPNATWLAQPGAWAQIQTVLTQAGIQYWAWCVMLDDPQQVQADPWAALTTLANASI